MSEASGGGAVRMEATARTTDDTSAEPHRWVVEAATYDDALAAARADTPSGSTLLYVRVAGLEP